MCDLPASKNKMLTIVRSGSSGIFLQFFRISFAISPISIFSAQPGGLVVVSLTVVVIPVVIVRAVVFDVFIGRCSTTFGTTGLIMSLIVFPDPESFSSTKSFLTTGPGGIVVVTLVVGVCTVEVFGAKIGADFISGVFAEISEGSGGWIKSMA